MKFDIGEFRENPLCKGKIKVKVTLEQVTKAQSRDISLFFL